MTIGRRRSTAARVWITGAALLLAGCAPASATSSAASVADRQLRSPSAPATEPSPPSRSAQAPAAAAAVKRYRSARGHETAPAPVRVRLPSIGVSSTLQRLGRAGDGTIDVPNDWQQAGWFREGSKPGQAGPAVILGHVDSKAGPAVFFRLRELRPGDEVHVDREDGSVATFVVERTERHAKTRFPTHEVYLPTLEPALRLVTCGGEFDSARGSYEDNVVVFASLAE